MIVSGEGWTEKGVSHLLLLFVLYTGKVTENEVAVNRILDGKKIKFT